MKKKNIILAFALIFAVLSSIFLVGCSVDIKALARQNVSEKVETYFVGEGSFSINISSGEREDPYKYDGISREKKDFALIVLFVKNSKSKVNLDVEINGQVQTVELEENLVDGSFMGDLEKKLQSTDEIKAIYEGEEVLLSCKSNEFNISCDDALDIAIEAFQPEMTNLVSRNSLKMECYIRVLDNHEGAFDKIFWYFYISAENGTSNYCIITVDRGNIIVKN